MQLPHSENLTLFLSPLKTLWFFLFTWNKIKVCLQPHLSLLSLHLSLLFLCLRVWRWGIWECLIPDSSHWLWRDVRLKRRKEVSRGGEFLLCAMNVSYVNLILEKKINKIFTYWS
jgi:hypothetical protein